MCVRAWTYHWLIVVIVTQRQSVYLTFLLPFCSQMRCVIFWNEKLLYVRRCEICVSVSPCIISQTACTAGELARYRNWHYMSYKRVSHDVIICMETFFQCTRSGNKIRSEWCLENVSVVICNQHHFLYQLCSSSNDNNKPVGDWISAPSPNVVDPQTMTDSVTHRCKFWGVNFGHYGA